MRDEGFRLARRRGMLKALALATLLLTPVIATADTAAPKAGKVEAAKLSDDEVKLSSHVKMVNDMEIQMGKLAQANGSAPVKKYGAMLVKDHTANNTKLAALGKKKGLAKLPAEVPTTDAEKAEHKAAMDAMTDLKKVKGADFDTKFLAMMIADHEKVVVQLTNAEGLVKDADLLALIKETKPVVQGHADQAKDLASKPAPSK